MAKKSTASRPAAAGGARGRKPGGGSSAKPKEPPEAARAPAGAKHNDPNDEQYFGLLSVHGGKVEKLQAAVKAAVANVRNAYKEAKSHGVSKADIDEWIKQGSDDAEAKLIEEIQRVTRIARCRGLPIGAKAQLSLFDTPDRTPADDRAYDEGSAVGREGGPRKPPYHHTSLQFERWMDGYKAGQDERIAAMGKMDPTKAQAAQKATSREPDPPGSDEPMRGMPGAKPAASAASARELTEEERRFEEGTRGGKVTH